METQQLGAIIQETSGLSEQVIGDALAQQREKGGRLGDILMRQKTITEEELLTALGRQFGLDVYTKLPSNLDLEFTKTVPIHFLKKFGMIPVLTQNDNFVAVTNPLYYQQLDDLRRKIDMLDARAVLAPNQEILTAINDAYNTDKDSEDAAKVLQDMGEDDPEKIISAIEETDDLLDDTSDAPIIRLVNLMFSQAARLGASDIHIEPYRNKLRIRQRLDGILYDMLSPPAHIHSALVSRIKIMADLNIAEKRLPQDGRISIQIGNKNLDIRVSTLPTPYGERVVLRILQRSNVLMELDNLGMPRDRLEVFNNLIKAAHGIILVTGPTGSGKTTTLYAALNKLNSEDLNIMTVEDPIEYRIDGIGQVQVNPKIDLTFANGLRSIVRQDPDVILIGEIRDLETAEIAIQSALTGHLVFSTLHTNDSAGAVTRLVNMGIESFLVTSSVNAIAAQRLVRVLCRRCREKYVPDPETVAKIGFTTKLTPGAEIYRHAGCSECLHTGYQGRNALFELMLMSENLKKTAIRTPDANAIKKAALAEGMVSLLDDGLAKIKAGVTSIEEVFRVTQH